MPPLFRSRPQLAAALVAAALLTALGCLPLFSGPGYELALGAGVVLPAAAAIATALEVARHRPAPFLAFARGLGSGLRLALIALLIAWFHGLRTEICDPAGGTVLFLLGPSVGALLGGAWGAVAGLASERARGLLRPLAAAALALAGPLAGVAVSLIRFYTSPMVFAYDPFFGFFSGPLYDTIIEPVSGLLSYRVGSAASLLAATALFLHLRRDDAGRVRLGWIGHPGLVLLGALGLVGSVAITLSGPALGHWATTAAVRQELGRSVMSERCEVVHSSAVLERDARLVARECDAHLSALDAYFGTQTRERITVFLFASPAEKGRWMGAANTYIAKPWRREVYIQAAPYPHPVLGHELSHVVAGGFGRGPFAIAGVLGGWLPDPGRIEGFAVAASPPELDDLTVDQWARAMKDLGILPRLEQIFRLSFLGENSSTAYTVAGSFVGYVRDRFGPEILRRWYGGEPLDVLLGEGLFEIERAWLAHLDQVAISPEALHTAKVRFDRPAIFGRQCPHVVDKLAAEGAERLGRNDARGACERFEEVLALDPQHVWARLGLGTCALRTGDKQAARRRYAALADDASAPIVHRTLGEEALGDWELLFGSPPRAVQHYASVADKIVDEDRLRALEVKTAAEDAALRDAIVSLLIGDPELGRDWGVAAAELGKLSARGAGGLEGEGALGEGAPGGAPPARRNGAADAALSNYLLGKNFYNGGRFREAAAHLAAAKPLPTPRLEREAIRMRVVVACALGDTARARQAYAEWQARQDLNPAQRRTMARIAERCGAAR